MPRVARRIAPGVVYHVIARFVDRQWFIGHCSERQHYLRLLGRSLDRTDWKCLSYAVMSNHIHIALRAGRQPLWSWLKRVHSPFARWLNTRHERLGGIFAERPSLYAMAPENVGRLIAYIHNNPVRAKVVTTARASGWTSHRAYLGEVAPEPWIDVEEGLRLSSIANQKQFDRYVIESASDQRDPNVLAELTSLLKPRGRVILGTPIVGERVTASILIRPFAPFRPDPLRIIELVAASTGAEVNQVRSRTRRPAAVHARRVVVHIGKALGHIGSDIAASLGLSDQAVSKLAQQELSGRDMRVAQRLSDFLSDEAVARASVNRPR